MEKEESKKTYVFEKGSPINFLDIKEKAKKIPKVILNAGTNFVKWWNTLNSKEKETVLEFIKTSGPLAIKIIKKTLNYLNKKTN